MRGHTGGDTGRIMTIECAAKIRHLSGVASFVGSWGGEIRQPSPAEIDTGG